MYISDAASATVRPSAGELILSAAAVVIAGVSGAVLFAVAEGGYASFPSLATHVLFPAVVVLAALALAARTLGYRGVLAGLWTGGWIGAVATIALEIIRIIGFRVFHAMPGSMPMLMGVLLTNRVMQGPDILSNVVGWADHFWNGATFGMIYALLFGRVRPWAGPLYGFAVGTGFMVSPVPVALGAGFFGAGMDPGFALTVYLAHAAFGLVIGVLACRHMPAASGLRRVLSRPDSGHTITTARHPARPEHGSR